MKKILIFFTLITVIISSVFAVDDENAPKISETARIRRGIEEYNAKNYSAAEEFLKSADQKNLIVVFYEAKIQLDAYNDAAGAEKILLPFENELKSSKIPNIWDSYYALLLQCKFQQKKWKDIPTIFNKIKNPDEKSIYANSAYFYNKGDYSKVDSTTGLLYASALYKLQKYEEACIEYEKLNIVNLEYAKALFAMENYQKSYEIAFKTNDEQKDYLCGLCQFNLKNWELSKNHFTEYLRNKSLKSVFEPISIFYKGYCECNLGEYKDSYISFVRYTTENSDKENNYIKISYEYAAKSAIQSGDYGNAAIQAENILKLPLESEERQKNIIFCAQIYKDAGKYDKALEKLKPYLSQRSDFAAEALFLSAEIYENKGDSKEADVIYQKIVNNFSNSIYAEEAMYKTGENFYIHEDYSSALNRFTSYIYKYANGKYGDSALYFAGECSLKNGLNDKSVLYLNTLINKYTESPYVFGAKKLLLEAYTNQEDYNSALEIANELKKKYADLIQEEEINLKIRKLEKLVNGVDKRIVEKQSEFETYGGVKTKKGRIVGTQLVQLYAESSFTQNDAYNLAKELVENQLDDERNYAAVNAEFIADYERKNGSNKQAAFMYLKAAENYRSVEDSTGAARCLYSATDSFIFAQMPADAKQTADLLKELYPQSRQAQKVNKLIGE